MTRTIEYIKCTDCDGYGLFTYYKSLIVQVSVRLLLAHVVQKSTFNTKDCSLRDGYQ
jgi:hypothetical protein